MSHKAERKARTLLEDLGYWVVRAAGSMGTIDLAAGRDETVYLIEVKETGTTLADRTRVFRMTDNGGKGVEQRDALAREQDRHPWLVTGFLVRAKGHLPDHCHRWTWHSLEDIGNDTVLRADEGVPFHEVFT